MTSRASTITPPTTPTIIPTRGGFSEPKFDGLLDGTLEDVEVVEVIVLGRVEVAEEEVAF